LSGHSSPQRISEFRAQRFNIDSSERTAVSCARVDRFLPGQGDKILAGLQSLEELLSFGLRTDHDNAEFDGGWRVLPSLHANWHQQTGQQNESNQAPAVEPVSSSRSCAS
jgi:hypothetical protein